jgi:hypothetical protein
MDAFDIGFPERSREDVLEVLASMKLYYEEVAEDTITVTYKRSFKDILKCLVGLYTKGKPYLVGVLGNTLYIPDELRHPQEMPMKVEWVSVSRSPAKLLVHEAQR